MALKATIFKAQLSVSNTDRHAYGDFSITVARHPSETDSRMMLRILAFALHADEALVFGRGISSAEEPDLWLKDLTGAVQLWIELGTPDPDRLRKACSRADQVVLYAYGDRGVPVWWKKHGNDLQRFDNLAVYQVDDAAANELAALAAPTMSLHCTIMDGEVYIGDQDSNLTIRPVRLKDA